MYVYTQEFMYIYIQEFEFMYVCIQEFEFMYVIQSRIYVCVCMYTFKN